MNKTQSKINPKAGAAGLVALGILGGLFGAFGGAAGYTAHYASAASYLSNDPKACTNCHIMNEQYHSWSSSSHHARATCNDCHVPNDSIIAKYYVKAEHGYRHSKGFTFNDFHEPIQITKPSRDVVIENCIRCHEAFTHEIRAAGRGYSPDSDGITGGSDCIHCHSSIAHGPTR